MKITVEDHSAELLREFEAACSRALETCGQAGEGYAKQLCPVAVINGGKLRNSITHNVNDEEKAAYIGSPVEYATYVEMGTGKYYPGGRPTPWVYQDEKGNWHRTNGQPAKPFIKPAVADNRETYKRIIEQALKGTNATVSIK